MVFGPVMAQSRYIDFETSLGSTAQGTMEDLKKVSFGEFSSTAG